MRFWNDDSRILPRRICSPDRRRDLRRRCCLAALFAIPFCLFACGNQKPASTTARAIQVTTELATEQILNRRREADPRSLDPSLITDVVGQRVLDALFE